ncbi:MAG: type II secretion system protein [Candidatus Paceibacterota bacterium]
MRTCYKNNGIALIEILVGIAIVGFVLVFVSHTITLFLSSSELVLQQSRAVYLAEEGQELVRYLRDEDWNTIADLTEGTTYYVSVSTTTISATTSPEIIDDLFTRSFVVEELLRDGNDDVVDSGGSVDQNGRIVTVDVSWNGESVNFVSIITNLYDL